VLTSLASGFWLTVGPAGCLRLTFLLSAVLEFSLGLFFIPESLGRELHPRPSQDVSAVLGKTLGRQVNIFLAWPVRLGPSGLARPAWPVRLGPSGLVCRAGRPDTAV